MLDSLLISIAIFSILAFLLVLMSYRDRLLNGDFMGLLIRGNSWMLWFSLLFLYLASLSDNKLVHAVAYVQLLYFAFCQTLLFTSISLRAWKGDIPYRLRSKSFKNRKR